MTRSVKIYGHEVPLEPVIGNGGIATDVVILTRVVYPGQNADALLINPSVNTTGIVQEGMFKVASSIMAAGWGHVQ